MQEGMSKQTQVPERLQIGRRAFLKGMLGSAFVASYPVILGNNVTDLDTRQTFRNITEDEITKLIEEIEQNNADAFAVIEDQEVESLMVKGTRQLHGKVSTL